VATVNNPAASGSFSFNTASYNGNEGDGTYAFDTIATDKAGNAETTSSAQTHTQLDTTPPTSSVKTLPTYSPGSFPLSWSGSDNGGSDAIASYSVYYTEDSGTTPTLLLGPTASTSTMFTQGQDGHRYTFYTIATDQAGNVQARPVAPTTTTVDTIPPASSVNPLPPLSLPSITVSWSGLDPSDPLGVSSGIQHYDLFYADVTAGTGFQHLLGPTTATSSVFSNTVPGHTYAFYTIAMDQAGNSEIKTTADTHTEVPIVTPSPVLKVAENSTNPQSLTIKTALTGHYSDAHSSKKEGIAVVSVDGNGTWQYSTNGSSWTAISSVSFSNALLLPATDMVRFLPAFDQFGEADLLYVGWDGSVGSAAGQANITAQGAGTAFSTAGGQFEAMVQSAPHAPGWSATTTTLTPVLPGGANTGETVQAAFGTLFVDPSPVSANIAVTGLTGNGTWMYKLAHLSVPLPFPTSIKSGQAVLLKGADSIFFVPKASANGAPFTGEVSLNVRAWDGGGGFTDGTTVTLNTTNFSTAVLTASLYFNHAPMQHPSAQITLTTNENTTSKVVSVNTLVTSTTNGGGGVDADPNQTKQLGMAITGVSGPGTLQYLLSSTWLNVPATVSPTAALLLPYNAQLRFMPTPDQTGTATFTWLAWDGTQGAAGQSFNTTNSGGATAFSVTSATATLTINPLVVPPAPTWNGTGAMLTPVVVPLTTPPQYNTVASVFGNYFESSGGTMGIAVSAVSGATGPTPSGAWFYSTNGGKTWNSLAAASSTAAVLLLGTDLIRYVPKPGFLGTVTLTAHAWDGSTASGIPGGTVNLTKAGATGGTSHISGTTLVATCLVNTAPTLR
jgi:hypothetical protein